MKRIFLTVGPVLLATAMLSACGGGGGGTPVMAATSQTAIAVNATTGPTAVQAVAGQTVTFPSGVSDFGTSGTPTTLSVAAAPGSTPTFSASAGSSTASGTMTFGSCIFTVASSTFPAGSKLFAGAKITIEPCTFTLNTAGVVANNTPQKVNLTVNLNGSTGTGSTMAAITGNGEVIINGVVVSNTNVASVTGS